MIEKQGIQRLISLQNRWTHGKYITNTQIFAPKGNFIAYVIIAPSALEESTVGDTKEVND